MTTPEPVPECEVVRERALADLAGGAWDALKIRPPGPLFSILGAPRSWLPMRHSEYALAYSWRVLRTARYLAEVAIPSMPVIAPAWFPEPLSPFVWHPSVVRQQPDHEQSSTSHPDEAWLFVNGILTDDNVARLNADYLADLFHRPITLIENATDGLFEDLAECAREKSFGRIADATATAFPAIHRALKAPEKQRVVVIAHSQGTIIAAAVLRLLAIVYGGGRRRAASRRDPHATRNAVKQAGVGLDPTEFEPLDRDELAKLELYCFANCATHMQYVDDTAGRRLPWIESYANEYDAVARLGMLAPRARRHGVVIDGPRYMNVGAWGHLLNRHYLSALDAGQRRGHLQGPKDPTASPYVLLDAESHPDVTQPRLFGYLNGGSPPPA